MDTFKIGVNFRAFENKTIIMGARIIFGFKLGDFLFDLRVHASLSKKKIDELTCFLYLGSQTCTSVNLRVTLIHTANCT